MSGVFLTPRWVPVDKVNRVMYRDRGREMYPEVARVLPDRVQLTRPLEHWRAVYLDYSVSVVEEDAVTVQVVRASQVKIPLQGRRLIVAIIAIHDDEGQPVEYTGYTFESVCLARLYTGRLRVRYRAANPTAVGYRSFEIEQQDFRPGRVSVKLEAGEIEVVVDHSAKMGAGDIITMLQSDIRAQHTLSGSADGIDRVMYGPIKEILNVWGVRRAGEPIREMVEGLDFVQNDFESIRWLTPRPIGGATIMYLYHPSFQIVGPVSIGSGGNRNAPRLYRARAISSYSSLAGEVQSQ